MRFPRLMNTNLRPFGRVAATCFVGCLGLVLNGCLLDVPSFIDPGELAGIREGSVKEPLLVNILEDLDPAMEQENRQFAAAEPPRPEDMVIEPMDYVVGPGDLLEVTIFNLEGPGLQTIKRVRVSGTGNLTLPYLNNVVRSEGLTEGELQQGIAEAYRQAGVLDPADVSVSVLEQRNAAYTISGSVQRPGQYVITDEDFRLLDALTTAGDPSSPFIEEAYIIRSTRERGGAGAEAERGGPGVMPANPTTRPTTGRPATRRVDQLAPQSSLPKPAQPKLRPAVLLQVQAGQPAAEVAQTDDDPTARVGVIDGKEVVVQPGEEDMTARPPADDGKPFEFNDLPSSGDQRIIRVPLSKLRNGDLQYNVAIRPRDRIIVPPGNIGFYYMDGHVANRGAYAFNGQKITLMRALASANGLDGLAIPQRTDIVRRIGPNQQMFVRVDVAKIFAGKAPDIYLKPDDQVMVGTNFVAPFLAAIRGGFRMTYGFGFLYDRNFAYDQDDQRR